MKDYETQLINEVDDVADEYGIDTVLSELVPHMTLGEIVAVLYETGNIPDDKLEEFLNG